MNSKNRNSKFKMPKSLFFFIVTAFLFWMLIKLSKTYEAQQEFKVYYNNLPEDKLLQNEPPKTLRLNIEGSGFKLIASSLFGKAININTRFLQQKTKNSYYLLPSKQTRFIQNQIRSGLAITSFESDTIFFSLGYLASKKVPVIPNYRIGYKTGFNLADKIQFDKDSVTISGPEQTIDTITKLYLTFRDFKNVSTAITEDLKINVSKNLDNVTLSDSVVNIKINVEKFTEGELEVPFKIINVPPDIQINTFPKTIKVTFKVGLSKFNQVVASDYQIVCDYQYSFENNLSYLIPKLMEKSELASSEKITPNKIDFLIQK